MITVFYVTHRDDYYEIALKDLRITRVSRYSNGTNHRNDMSYDDLPIFVQDEILKKIQELITKHY